MENKLLTYILQMQKQSSTQSVPKLPKAQKGKTVFSLKDYASNINTLSNDNIPRQPAFVKEFEQREAFNKQQKEKQLKELQEREFNNRSYISQDRSTPASRAADKQRFLEAKRQEAMANSPLAQTFGSFTPSGNNSAAGSIAASQFVKTMPLIAGTAAGATALPSIMAGLNAPIAGVAGLTGNNIMNAGFAYEAAKNLPNVGRSIKTAYQKPTLSNVGNATAETALTALNALPFAAEASRGVTPLANEIKNAFTLTAAQKNLKDLNYAKKVYGPLGYQIPENLERIAQSDVLTDRTVRGLVNRDNSVYRGVNVDLEALKERLVRSNKLFSKFSGKPPQEAIDQYDVLIGNLKKANVDVNNPEEIAKYMATHIPAETGAGRAYLDPDVMKKRGISGLYTSNSKGTAEGYTYGEGYVVKAKKPTDFSSSSRKAWIDNNIPDIQTGKDYKYSRFFPKPITWKTDYQINDSRSLANYREKLGRQKLEADYPSTPTEYNGETWDAIHPEVKKFNDRRDQLRNIAEEEYNLAADPYKDKLFTVEDRLKRRSENYKLNNTSTFKKVLNVPAVIRDLMMEGYYGGKVSRLNQKNADAWNDATLATYLEKYPELANAYPEVNPYAHYINIGKPGEKVLEAMSTRKITPETWINKSRGHQGEYFRQATRREFGGMYSSGGPIVDPMGQWAHPGQVTRIPSANITMQGVPYPVLGIASNGKQVMMQPGQDYNFGNAEHVDEYPMMQNGGNTLPEAIVYGHKDPSTKAYFDKVRTDAEKWQDEYYWNTPTAGYNALEQMHSKYGAPKINTIREKDRAYYNPMTDSMNISIPKYGDEYGDPVENEFLDELAHKVQANKKGTIGMVKEHLTKDLINTLKNVDSSSIFTKRGWLNAYEKNYDTPGTVENEAHSVIAPKLKEEYRDIRSKQYDRLYGDMAMGGSLPGAVGFTYARTQDPAPANGKYTKKTLASAQNGKGIDLKSAPDYLNSYFQGPEFKKRYDAMHKHGNKLPKVLAQTKSAYTNYKPAVIEDNPKDMVGSRVGSATFNSSFGVPKETSIILSKAQAKKYNMDLANEVLPHEFAHNRELDDYEQMTIGYHNKNMNKVAGKYNEFMDAGEIVNAFKENREPDFSTWLKLKDHGMHDMAPDENYSDINALRFLMNKQGIYDTRKGPMNLEHFKKAQNDPFIKNQFIFKRLLKTFKPKDIIKLNNEVAMNDEQGYIPQAQSGGYVVTRSNDRKGKTHKVTGPGGVVKYFGDSKLGQHPKDPERKAAFYARHKKNLDGNPFFRAFARKTWEDGGTIPQYQFAGAVSSTDSLRHQAAKMMDFEAKKGSPTGTGLSNWGYHQSQMPYNMQSPNWKQPRTKDEAVNMYMQEIAPRLQHFPSAMEKGEAGDFLYNTGRDPRVYMLDQYLKSKGQSGIPNRGAYNVDTKTPAWTPQLQQSLNDEWKRNQDDIYKLPVNDRRVLLNKGRDFYYQNINKKADGTPNDSYKATWKPRIWESVNTYKKGGQTDDDREMLSGVADMLRRVNDVNNRKQIANYMMNNFREEDVSFEPNKFLKSANAFKEGGEMIRRADGSYSRRGLWDNIRDNKGSGKKPTKQMLEQERKINSMQFGGLIKAQNGKQAISKPIIPQSSVNFHDRLMAQDEATKKANLDAMRQYYINSGQPYFTENKSPRQKPEPWTDPVLDRIDRENNEKYADSDGGFENFLEFIDPTGISSWDDVSRTFRNPSASNVERGFALFSALPYVGNLSKLAKGTKAINTAVKGNALQKIGRGALKGAAKTIDIFTGGPVMRYFDQSINPLSRAFGTLTEKAVGQIPYSGVRKAFEIGSDFNQMRRFQDGVLSPAFNQLDNYMTQPANSQKPWWQK